MHKLLASTYQRYALAIIISAALMIWQSMDAVRSGADLNSQALFWATSVTAGWLQMIVIARGVRSTFGASKRPGWVLLAIGGLIGAIPLTFQVRWMMTTIVAPETGLPAPWVTYFNVTLICIVFGLIQYLLVERWPLFAPAKSDVTPAPLADTGPTMQVNTEAHPQSTLTPGSGHDLPALPIVPTVNMLSRPPQGLDGTINYLRVEDHYLTVCTDAGSAMTLHRMSDAVSDLSSSDGLQVHKSWWVSRAAVKEVQRRNRARSIVTHDGTEIPIGRSFEKSLRQARWF